MREQWVDISKGAAITLMVIGHTSIPIWASNWIYSFHMPFFFFISALFVNWEKGGIWSFAKRKAKVLLLPWIIYSIINLLLWPVVKDETLADFALATLQKGWGGVALWFVPVFYFSNIIIKSLHRRHLPLTFFIMIALAWTLDYFSVVLPWTLSTVPFAVAIMALTRYFTNCLRGGVLQAKTVAGTAIAIGCFVVGSIGSQFWRLDMAWNNVIPIVPIFVLLMCGIVFISWGSICIQEKNIVAKIMSATGRNTFEIMALSQVIIAMLSKWIPVAVVRFTLMIVLIVVAVYLRKIITRYVDTLYIKCCP